MKLKQVSGLLKSQDLKLQHQPFFGRAVPGINQHVVRSEPYIGLHAAPVNEAQLMKDYSHKLEYRAVPPRSYASRIEQKVAAGHKRYKRQPLHRIANPPGVVFAEPARVLTRGKVTAIQGPPQETIIARVLQSDIYRIYTHNAQPNTQRRPLETQRSTVTYALNRGIVRHTIRRTR